MIRFECSCGAKLKAEEEQVGQEFDCPKCGKLVCVPGPFSIAGYNLSETNTADGKPATKSIEPPKEMDRRQNCSPPYPECRRLQRVLFWSGRVSLALAVIVLLAIIPLGLAAVAACTGFLFTGYVNLSLSELLGGTVAFLVKHGCYPDQPNYSKTGTTASD